MVSCICRVRFSRATWQALKIYVSAFFLESGSLKEATAVSGS